MHGKCFARFINWLETLTGIDLDGDGDIGVMGTTSMPGLDGDDPTKTNQFDTGVDLREQKMYKDRAEQLKDARA